MSRNIRLLRPDGRLLQVSLMEGAKAEIDLARVMSRRLTVTGSTLRPRSKAVKAMIASELFKKVWPLFEENKINPIIYETFSFNEAPKAHRLMETSKHIGKIIMTIS